MVRGGAILAALFALGWPQPGLGQTADLEALVAKAAAEGLPTAPLRNKAREGRIKRVPLVRVASVIRAMTQHMRQARRWLSAPQRPAPPSLLAAVAEARLAGISTAALRLAVRPASARAVSRVDALVDLHLRGFPQKDAAKLVRSSRATDLVGLGKRAERLRKAGRSHREALVQLRRSPGVGRNIAPQVRNRGRANAAGKGRAKGKGGQ